MSKLFYIFYIVIVFTGCVQLELEDKSNESIPNYSITIPINAVNPESRSNLIPLDDNSVIMAIESDFSEIAIMRYTQDFENDVWSQSSSIESEIGNGRLLFFDKLNNNYLLGFINSSDNFEVQYLDSQFNSIGMVNDYEIFIDTFYNDIDSLVISDFSYVNKRQEILLGGFLYSQGKTYSCVLNVNENLEPLWIKTYFENSEITDLVSLNQDSFLLVQNTVGEGADLIRDNESSSAYHKYNLSKDNLFFGNQTFIDNERIFLTGIHNSVGRLIEVDIVNVSAFVNEVEIYPISDFRAVYLSRDNIVTSGIQSEMGQSFQFSSELSEVGSIWCHRYTDERYFKILDIIEMPGKGIMISSIVEVQQEYFIHLTRIDEEGARFDENGSFVENQYTENCL